MIKTTHERIYQVGYNNQPQSDLINTNIESNQSRKVFVPVDETQSVKQSALCDSAHCIDCQKVVIVKK